MPGDHGNRVRRVLREEQSCCQAGHAGPEGMSKSGITSGASRGSYPRTTIVAVMVIRVLIDRADATPIPRLAPLGPLLASVFKSRGGDTHL